MIRVEVRARLSCGHRFCCLTSSCINSREKVLKSAVELSPFCRRVIVEGLMRPRLRKYDGTRMWLRFPIVITDGPRTATGRYDESA